MDKVLAIVIGIPLAVVIMIFRFHIVQVIGKLPWAEQKLGPGGTYIVVVLFAILLMMLAISYATGGLEAMIADTVGKFFVI